MCQNNDPEIERFYFTVDVLDASLTEAEVRALLQESLASARAQLSLDEGLLRAEVEGGFLGIGELGAVLLLKTAGIISVLKTAGIISGSGVLAGMSKKLGEYIFDEYFAPQLRKRNLLARLQSADAGSDTAEESVK